MFNKDFFNKIDVVLVGAVFLAIIFGILLIYSAGFDPATAVNKGLYKKQIIWFIIGVIFMLVMSIIHYRALGDYALYIYGFFMFVLVITTAFGRPIAALQAMTRRWWGSADGNR